jgi:hypothetical protein
MFVVVYLGRYSKDLRMNGRTLLRKMGDGTLVVGGGWGWEVNL